MIEPTTPAEWNERVAKAVGYPSVYVLDGHVLVANEGDPVTEKFAPWGDKPENIAVAVWVLEKFCEERGLDPVLEKYQGVWECALWHDVEGGSKILKKEEGSLTEVICRVILRVTEK